MYIVILCLTYIIKKIIIPNLLKYLGKNGFLNTQNYIPLYSEFFSLDEKKF